MLTPQQERWIAHLSDKAKIKIVPFDPSSEEKFQKVKKIIQKHLRNVSVEHHGASSLGISGQDEIDIYVPIAPNSFVPIVNRMKQLFGESKSFYEMQRARFVTEVEGKHVDVFIINAEHQDWKNLNIFESYLRFHQKALDEYRKLKESSKGSSVREYYRRKNEFINEILAKAAKSQKSK